MDHALHYVEVLKSKIYLYCDCHLQRQQALDSGTDYLLMKACKKMVKVSHHSLFTYITSSHLMSQSYDVSNISSNAISSD